MLITTRGLPLSGLGKTTSVRASLRTSLCASILPICLFTESEFDELLFSRKKWVDGAVAIVGLNDGWTHCLQRPP